MEIVTGSTPQAHVTPIDDAVRNSNFGYYGERIVFDTFRALEAVAITANEVRVYGGYGMNQGRLFKIDMADYDSVTIENGSQGVKRSDLIVARYTMNSQSGFEDISLVVIKGQSGQTYTDPSYTTGNINEGAALDDFPLYRVKINGIVIEAVEPLFTPTPDGGRLGIIEQRLNGNMIVDLEGSSRNYLDGSENVDLGVKGTLPITHGGTGAGTKEGAVKKLIIDSAVADSNAMSDNTEFITSESNSGFINAIKKRTAVNIWNYIMAKLKAFLGMGNTDIVSVAHGGTGKSSIGNRKVLVGNSSGGFSEYDIGTSLDNPDNTHLATTKAVNDAMSSAGLGDMLKATYDPDGNGIIGIEQGGTGANTVAGARNALGLGNTPGALPVANGGTGATTINQAKHTLGIERRITIFSSTTYVTAGQKFNITLDDIDALEYIEVHFYQHGSLRIRIKEPSNASHYYYYGSDSKYEINLGNIAFSINKRDVVCNRPSTTSNMYEVEISDTIHFEMKKDGTINYEVGGYYNNKLPIQAVYAIII